MHSGEEKPCPPTISAIAHDIQYSGPVDEIAAALRSTTAMFATIGTLIEDCCGDLALVILHACRDGMPQEADLLDEKGRSDFGLLQRAVGRRPAAHQPGEIILYAFDLLELRRLPQRERRRPHHPRGHLYIFVRA
jgi:hypothetical protein